jgi:hypothetical protein
MWTTVTTQISVFQPIPSLGTFETLLSIWQNLNTQNSVNMKILKEPIKEIAEPLGFTKPRLKNTYTDTHHWSLRLKKNSNVRESFAGSQNVY